MMGGGIKAGFSLRAALRVAKRFAASRSGATAIEYGLIVSLIFLAIIGAVRGYVDSTSVMYSEIVSAIEN